MRLITFELSGQVGFGAVNGGEVVRLDTPDDTDGLKGYLARRHGAWTSPALGIRLPLSSVRLLPPVPDPSKIFCVAANFHEAGREAKPIPDYPILFTRIAEAQVGHESAILRPAVSEQYDFEGELAVVIGKFGHRIPRETALDHVAGYSCFNDGSVRDWQKHSSQYTPGKNFARSGSFGPWLVTADEIPSVGALSLTTRVNGVVKQSISLSKMTFDVPWLISYCSTFAPLHPGDVIATGTPLGFGSSRDPPEFLQAGDVVEVEISGVGLLRNSVEQDFDPRTANSQAALFSKSGLPSANAAS